MIAKRRSWAKACSKFESNGKVGVYISMSHVEHKASRKGGSHLMCSTLIRIVSVSLYVLKDISEREMLNPLSSRGRSGTCLAPRNLHFG